MKSVIVPLKVMSLCHAMSRNNTFKNIETCEALEENCEKII